MKLLDNFIRNNKKIIAHSVKQGWPIDIIHDAIQETYLKSIIKQHQLKNVRNRNAWLKKIYKNCLYTKNNLEKKYVSYEDIELQLEYTDNEHSETHKDILKFLNKLTKTQCEICSLYFLKNHSIVEISNITNKATGTVKSIIYQAKKNNLIN